MLKKTIVALAIAACATGTAGVASAATVQHTTGGGGDQKCWTPKPTPTLTLSAKGQNDDEHGRKCGHHKICKEHPQLPFCRHHSPSPSPTPSASDSVPVPTPSESVTPPVTAPVPTPVDSQPAFTG